MNLWDGLALLVDWSKDLVGDEAWLWRFASTIAAEKFVKAGFPLPLDQLRIVVRPMVSWQTGRFGQCDARGQTWSFDDDSKFLILISPKLTDPVVKMVVLLHELCHTAVGNRCNHRGQFRVVAQKIGLVGPKFTIAHASLALTDELVNRVRGQLGV